MESVLQEIMVE